MAYDAFSPVAVEAVDLELEGKIGRKRMLPLFVDPSTPCYESCPDTGKLHHHNFGPVSARLMSPAEDNASKVQRASLQRP